MSRSLFLSLLSAVIMATGHLLYMGAIARRESVPNKVTWGIIAVNTAILLANQIASGINEALWGMLITTTSIGLVTLFAFWRGVAKITTLDLVVIVVAMVGIVLWQMFDDPLISVVASGVTSVLSIIPTIKKLQDQPGTENTVTWFLAGISMVIFLFAVEPKIDFLLVPAVWIVLNFLIAYLSTKKAAEIKIESLA